MCQKCSQRIDADDECFIVCKGNCSGSFHCRCVGLRGMQWKTINDLSRNVLWMCECCMDDYMCTKNGNSSKTTTPQTIEDDVNKLKIAVAGIMDTIATITKTIPTSSPTNCELKHPTTSVSTLLNGTAYEDEDNTNDVESQHTDDGGNFSLLLTNIDSSTTEHDIQCLVSRAIRLSDPENIDVTKLVSKRKSYSNFVFFSSK